jgi:hypothetical protein
MESVAGIFVSRDKAEHAVERIRSLGIPEERIVLLTPHTPPGAVESEVRTTDAESPGIGEALGATVGGAIGAAGGATLGAAAATLMVPGVGPVLAAGILGAAVLGLGGAVTGATLGEALEEGMEEGLPHDELYLYEEALRKGRSVIIAFVEDDDQADKIRNIFGQEGAESVDAAREDWWLGLRDAEEQYYQAQGRDFVGNEVSYRRGFEAALNTRFRGKKYSEVSKELEEFCHESGTDEAFRHGYERGLAHLTSLREKTRKATTATG